MIRAAVLVGVLVLSSSSLRADNGPTPDEILAGQGALLDACGEATNAGGTVKVTVSVRANGTVKSVTATGSSDAKLNSCVATMLKTARFGAQKKPAVLTHSFDFEVPSPPGPGILLSRGIREVGIAKVSSKIRACSLGLDVTGRLTIRVIVEPDGSVSSVTVKQTPSDYVSDCVAKVVKTAVFAKTKQGGTFTLPISVSPKRL